MMNYADYTKDLNLMIGSKAGAGNQMTANLLMEYIDRKFQEIFDRIDDLEKRVDKIKPETHNHFHYEIPTINTNVQWDTTHLLRSLNYSSAA